MPNQYPQEFRERIVALARSGRAVSGLSTDYEVAGATIYRWLDQDQRDHGEVVEWAEKTLTDCSAWYEQRLADTISGYEDRLRLQGDPQAALGTVPVKQLWSEAARRSVRGLRRRTREMLVREAQA